MISVEQARVLILENVPTMRAENVALQDLTGRVLAAPVHAMIDLPNFTNSAVDGYAIRSEDAGAGPLKLIGRIAAGDDRTINVEQGQAVRVFTGSALPCDSDAVVMQEDVTVDGDSIQVNVTVESGQHVRLVGEEIRRGEKVFDPGIVVNPAILGALSTLGFASIEAYARPRVAVIGTGNELVAPGNELRGSQIFESNTPAISSALTLSGACVMSVFHVKDDLDEIKKVMRRGLTARDILVTCGGVSVGEHDHIRAAATSLGIQEVFWRVAMRPGKPFYFGLAPDGQPVFGLPGNPVSALIGFIVLVRPALLKMMGADPTLLDEQAVLGTSVKKQAGRMDFVRATVSKGKERVAFPTEGQGSHMITGLANATHLIHLPADVDCVAAGEMVTVTRLQWSLC